MSIINCNKGITNIVNSANDYVGMIVYGQNTTVYETLSANELMIAVTRKRNDDYRRNEVRPY